MSLPTSILITLTAKFIKVNKERKSVDYSSRLSMEKKGARSGKQMCLQVYSPHTSLSDARELTIFCCVHRKKMSTMTSKVPRGVLYLLIHPQPRTYQNR